MPEFSRTSSTWAWTFQFEPAHFNGIPRACSTWNYTFQFCSSLFNLRMSSGSTTGKLIKAKKVPREIKFGYVGEDEDRGSL